MLTESSVFKSRTKAISTFTRDAMDKILKDRGVDLIGGGLDKSPMAYKNIDQVWLLKGTWYRSQRNFHRSWLEWLMLTAEVR